MASSLVECVPNFSEGRDPRVVEAIVNAIGAVGGASVLAYESDRDHNRSVVTFAGRPAAVVRAALEGITKAVKLIRLPEHTGVHPRIGAADVVPLVPLEGITLEECAALARELGAEVWRRLRLPVYFYEAAARSAERKRLENLRRGGIEWLREHMSERPPDLGDPVPHPSAGAVVIGARKLLVAFNVNLNTTDVGIAREVARRVRESSGGLKCVKAIGVPLASRGQAQVSMNLTDFDVTGLGTAFDAVRRETETRGARIASTEIIGLVPRRALTEAAAALLVCENFSPGKILEDRINQVSGSQVSGRSFDTVLEQISAPEDPHGGGSAAALTGAAGAALGHMAARIAKVDSGHFLEHRDFFAAAVDRDAEAFAAVRAGGGQPALRNAALVATGISERARELDRDLLRLKTLAPEKVHPDITTGLALARASRAGGIAAARSNLPLIEDEAFRREIEDRLDRKLAAAR